MSGDMEVHFIGDSSTPARVDAFFAGLAGVSVEEFNAEADRLDRLAALEDEQHAISTKELGMKPIRFAQIPNEAFLESAGVVAFIPASEIRQGGLDG